MADGKQSRPWGTAYAPKHVEVLWHPPVSPCSVGFLSVNTS
jgi:hypothetical protein